MKKLFIILAVVGLFSSCNKIFDYFPGTNHSSPAFKKVYGGSGQDEVLSMISTEGGGYFLAANNSSTNGDVTGNKGDKDGWAVKLNKAGAIEWQRSLGGSNYDLMYSAIGGRNDTYILAGLTVSNDGDVSGHHGEYDGWIVKLSSLGDLIWQKPYGGTGSENFEQIIKCENGGYLAVGMTNSKDGDVSGQHGEEDDGWVVKLNESGNIQWQKALGGTGTDRVYGATNTMDGGYLLVGTTTSADGDVSENHGVADAWVVKLDRNGNIKWEKTFGGSDLDDFNHVTLTRDGDFVMTGSTSSTDGDVSGNHGETDMWVVKINGKGKLQWQKTLGGSGFEQSREIFPTVDGGFVITGPSGSNDGDVSGNHGGTDGCIFKINSKGKKEWQKSIGGSDTDVLNTIIAKWDGTIAVAGWTNSTDGDATGNHGASDAWVVSIK